LFDEGALRSFITERLAADLALPMRNREFVKLAAFGETWTKDATLRKEECISKQTEGAYL